MGIFLVVKYSVLALTFPFCHYVQPLRRLLRPMQARLGRRNYRELAKRKLREEAARESGWRGNLGRKILETMDKLADMAARRRLWVRAAEIARLDPKQFALTVGEALVFYKMTFLVLGPLTFFALVKIYQSKNAASEFFEDYQSDLKDVVGEEEPIESGLRRFAGKTKTP